MQLHYQCSGEGKLLFPDSGELSCHFEVRQYCTGRLSVACSWNDEDPISDHRRFSRAPPLRLIGQSDRGEPVETDGELSTISTSPFSADFVLRSLQVGDQPSGPCIYEYALTNIDFPGSGTGSLPLPVRLEIEISEEVSSVLVELEPVPGYRELHEQQRLHKFPVPTAILRLRPESQVGDVVALVNRLCIALSVVQGQKISWIAQFMTDIESGSLCKSFHYRVTKPTSGMALNQSGENYERVPLKAVEQCYQKIQDMEREYEWIGPVLEVWLESRTDDGYIQTRSLKLVVVMEALRTAVMRKMSARRHLTDTQWSFFLKYIIPDARSYLLADSTVSKSALEAITNEVRWEQINRKSFRSDLQFLLKRLDVNESRRQIELFAKSRNKLVHEGNFRCISEPDAVCGEPDAPQDPVEEFMFLAGFVDRVVMRIAGLVA